LTGLRFSTATVRRVTEAVGAELHARHARGQAVPPEQPPAWDFTLPDRDGQKFAGTVAYAGLDAFAVPTRRRGGVSYKMLYVGLLYDPPKEHTLYLADYDCRRLAGLLRSSGVALGIGVAETVVALTDGGNGLERALRRGVSDAVVSRRRRSGPSGVCRPAPRRPALPPGGTRPCHRPGRSTPPRPG
jgi:hypothetical protein